MNTTTTLEATKTSSPLPKRSHGTFARTFVYACRDLALLASIAIAGWLLHRAFPSLPLPTTTLVLGVLVGSACSFAPTLRSIWPAAEIPLAVGMVLLGAQFDGAAARTVGVIGIALLCAHWFVVGALVRRALRIAGEEPRAASLVSVGLSGCGISAILAAKEGDPRTSERARLLAITSTLVVGATGFVVLPIVARTLALDATEVARLAGIAMPTTAEAVLVGGAHSIEALRGTGAFRFVVNVLQWIPVLGHARRVGAEQHSAEWPGAEQPDAEQHSAEWPGAEQPRAEQPSAEQPSADWPSAEGPGAEKPSAEDFGVEVRRRHEAATPRSIAATASTAVRRVPAFVWGLTLLAAFAASGGFLPEERVVLAHVTNWAFLMALAGVGFATRPLAIRALGWRPLAAATCAWLVGAAILSGAVLATHRWS